MGWAPLHPYYLFPKVHHQIRCTHRPLFPAQLRMPMARHNPSTHLMVHPRLTVYPRLMLYILQDRVDKPR